MANQKQGARGERGIQGPPGPAGPAGKTGDVGRTGATGPRGWTGSERSSGMTRNDRMEIVTLIEGQIDDIYKELDVQMKRMAQLQAHVDELRSAVRRLAKTAE